MDAEQLRLEALRIAAALRFAQTADGLVADAKTIVDWLTRPEDRQRAPTA